MKLRRQCILIISGMVTILSLLSFYQWNSQQKDLDQLRQISAEHHLSIFDHVVELKTGKFKTFAYDYSYWDELVAYVADPSPQWAQVNLEATMGIFETDALFVIDSKNGLIFQYGNFKGVEELGKRLQSYTYSLNKPQFENFFIATSEGPVEIFAAPIQKSDDLARDGKPYGYLVTAKKWDKALLNDLGAISQLNIDFVSNDKKIRYDRIYPLLGKENNTLYRIGMQVYSDESDMLTRIFQINFFSLLFFSALVMLFFIVTVYRKVLYPLQIMTTSMRNHDTTNLEQLTVRNDEIGEIAYIVKEFFAQQKDLKIQLERADEAEKEQLVIKDKIQKANAILMQRLQEKNKELEEINHSLDQRIREEIEKSRKQEQMLLQQSRLVAMGEMIGNIAHQWRQPLNALGLSIQNLEMASEFGELDHDYIVNMIDSAMKQVTYMSKTIDDFRNFVNPNSAQIRFDLGEAIEESIRLLNPTLNSSSIRTTVQKPEGTIKILGNASEFKQVIVNLINNAKDAFIENNIFDRVMKIRVVDDAERVIIEFEDNAGGIPSDIIGRIFEPYFTTKEEGKGTGIGLYMSYEIIKEKMNGSISAANTPNGVTFTIILPKANHYEEAQQESVNGN